MFKARCAFCKKMTIVFAEKRYKVAIMPGTLKCSKCVEKGCKPA